MRNRLYSARPTAAPAPTADADLRRIRLILIVSALAVGLAARYVWRDFMSDDWTTFLQYWQRFLIAFGGIPAWRYGFSNYAAPYTYVLTLATQTLGALPALYQVKLASVVFDVACAVLAYRLTTHLRPVGSGPGSPGPLGIAPAVAFACVFLAPTVVLNSAAWAQADSIFSALLLGALLALVDGRMTLAMTLYALSVSFKLQAGFLFPLFVFLALRSALPWRTFLVLPAVYALVNVPVLLAGRPLADALLVYGAQAGRYDDLTLKAPNVFQWLPQDPRDPLQWLGIAAAGAFMAGLWLIVRRPRPGTPEAVYVTFTALALLIGLPFFLPRMHDRYFYAADVVSIVLACAYATRQRAWPVLVALLVNAASLSAYIAYLWERDPSVPKLPLAAAAALMALGLTQVMWHLVTWRYRRSDAQSGGQPEDDERDHPLAGMGSPAAAGRVQTGDLSGGWRWVLLLAGGAAVPVALAAAIGGRVRAANDAALMTAVFTRDGYHVRLDRARATNCTTGGRIRLELSWIDSTLRLAPGTDIYSVFVHVYDASDRRVAVADGYIDGKIPLNDVEFDLTEARDLMFDASGRAQTIHVGVYALESQKRLHAARPDGTSWDGDEVVVPIRSGPCV